MSRKVTKLDHCKAGFAMKTFMKPHTCRKPGLPACAGIVVIGIAGCKPKSSTIQPPPVVEVATVTWADVPVPVLESQLSIN